jgi:NADH:ubiquinone oxidoreductase subunit 5 (subunit L)/multisubunit Na+/H+ antiporter MnhA subunit
LSDAPALSERLTSFSWIAIASFDVTFGIILDPLTVSMLVVVTFVSLLVQVYSISYMSHDSGYSRYFAYMSLFTASMIGLVIASNVVQLFIFWELVGLCSYLLIGFWFTKPSAASAAKKAFLVTRIGDFGFLIAILYLIFNTDGVSQFGNSLSIVDLGGNIGEAAKLRNPIKHKVAYTCDKKCFFAAEAALGLVNQNPISKYEHNPTSSQKINN